MKSLWLSYSTNSNNEDDINRELILASNEHKHGLNNIQTDHSYKVLLSSEKLFTEPNSTEVLLKIKACAISRIPCKLIQSLKPGIEKYPVGYEISGVVVKVGDRVTRFNVDDIVAGILPYTNNYPGCATQCICHEMYLVTKPWLLPHVDCAVSLRPGVEAYSALFYKGKILKDDIILICDAASQSGLMCVHLAHTHCAKIIAIVNDQNDAGFIKGRISFPITIIDISLFPKTLVQAILKETGGMGVNLIIDFGIKIEDNLNQHIKNSEFIELNSNLQDKKSLVNLERSFSYNDNSYTISLFSKKSGITKYQILSILASSGRWVTSQDNLQFDPPDTHMLFMKGASVSFLYTDTWTLDGAKHGKYLHILSDLVKKLEDGTITVPPSECYSIDEISNKLADNSYDFSSNRTIVLQNS